jgi:hypothetical protein
MAFNKNGFIAVNLEDGNKEELDYCFMGCDAVTSDNQRDSDLHSHHRQSDKYHGVYNRLVFATREIL